MKIRNLAVTICVLIVSFASNAGWAQEASRQSNSQLSHVSVGELHNAGVQYVLEHIKEVPRLDEVAPLVHRLTIEFCQKHDAECGPGDVKVIWNTERLLATVPGSAAFKENLRSLFKTVDQLSANPRLTRNALQGYQTSLNLLEKTSLEKLRGEERDKFLEAISVARSSAIFWAPKEAGGLEGKDFLKIRGVHDISPMEKLDPVQWDLAGALVGGLGGAIGASVFALLANLYL